MGTFLKRPKTEGEEMMCPDCNVELLGLKVTSERYGTSIRWVNKLDGSYHLVKPDGENLIHQTEKPSDPPNPKPQGQKIDHGIPPKPQPASPEMVKRNEELLALEDRMYKLAVYTIEKRGGDSRRGDVVQSQEAKFIECQKLLSAEIDEVLIHSSQVVVPTANKGSFHASSAVKDIDSSRQVEILPNPPFFSERIKWIAKCVKHGVICNEDDYICKQCKEEYMDSRFATGGTINRGLLL
jgi:hypothetical protein